MLPDVVDARYHTIPTSGSGSSGTNDETVGYDSSKRQNRQVTPGGTITRTVFDARRNSWKTFVGTNDTGATQNDPTGGGAVGNNMVQVSQQQFDGGADGGDNNLTQVTQYVDGSTTRVTALVYDWRNRRVDTDGEVDYFERLTLDNLDRVTKQERYNTSSAGNLIARGETKFDDRGRVYQSLRYGVNPSTGTVGNSLTDNFGTTRPETSSSNYRPERGCSRRSVYDGLGRRTKTYQGYDLSETSYADASTVTGDTIIEQTEVTYDAASNAIQTTMKQRFHNATGTGELNGPSGTQPKSRITYSAVWPDPVGRQQASADYGTNGGSSLSRPDTIPARSDTVLVTSLTYNNAGQAATQTNPGGVTTCLSFDAAGRQIETVMNCAGSSSSSSSSSSSRLIVGLLCRPMM